MRVPTGTEVVGIDSFGSDDLVVATSTGELCLTAPDTPTVHTKNDASITGLISLKNKMTLVFMERGNGKTSAAAYEAPDLKQISGLTLHEVCGGTVFDDSKDVVVVYTHAAIRVLRFDVKSSPKARILRTIELKGIISCCVSSVSEHTLLIATPTEYQLVNLRSGHRAPLFPITNELPPIMARLDEEFLVVQGISLEEPAMGLFVDAKGEITHKGIVVQWPAYPSCIACSADFVFSVVQSKLIVHQVQNSDIAENATQKKAIEEHGTVAQITKLSYPIKRKSALLAEKLGGDSLCFVETEIAFLYTNNKIELWTPTPRLVDLEQQILRNRLQTVEPDPRFSQSEQGIAELEYLSILLVLHLLDQNRGSEALKEWQRGAQIQPELVLYIYGYEDQLPVIYPGLIPLIEQLATKAGNAELDPAFLTSCLRTMIKRLRRNILTVDKVALIEKLEIITAKHLLNAEQDSRKFMRFMLEKDLRTKREIIAWLEETQNFAELERYFELAGKFGPLIKLKFNIMRDPKSSAETVQRCATDLLEIITNNQFPKHGELEIWDVAMEIIKNDRVDAELGFQLLTSAPFEAEYAAADVLQTLKELTEAGEPWRTYLKYLVYTKSMFKDDLVTLVLTDIIEHSQLEASKEAVEKSYHLFITLDWPKPAYKTWLLQLASKRHSQTREELGYPADLLRLQVELWKLLEGDIDLPQIVPMFETRLHDFVLEKALIFQKMGLHQQSLELFADIHDYRSIIEYSTITENDETRCDLAYLALRTLLQQPKPVANEANDAVHEYLCSNQQNLDFRAVLGLLDDSTPFHVVGDFMVAKTKDLQKDERSSQVYYSISKASSRASK